MLKNTAISYGIVAKTFHWLLLLMLASSIVMGNLLAALPKGPEKLQAAGMHKSFGALLLALILLRLLWRLINETPKLPDSTTMVQAILAKGMHGVLYLLMFLQPLSGILMSQAGGIPVSVFGLFEFPILLDKNPGLAELARSIHRAVWILLVLATLGHVGAALHHHFIKKDHVLKQMTFGK
ncbi:cytochrome b [Halomonas nitroreducens]|uniref:Cytochrome b n=1 Tax=Halomonas nitroreducens TaxID=447425 RepID=A0A3S0J6V2_9GAMM|nr:cytochrome b [Halomonas nitroreducens]RTQ98356.1 cytochrome b [Halomonas nitroreducens]